MVTGYQLTLPPKRGRGGLLVLAIIIVLILLGAETIASYVVKYQWWREMNQVPTWIALMLYELSPAAVATLLTFMVLFAAICEE
jgi:hypothetical protein